MNFAHRYIRQLAWLALFAIGLTIVMPAVSRVVMMAKAPIPMLPYGCGPQAGHSAPTHGGPAGLSLDACGYCSLFCHTPLHIDVPPALQLAAPQMPPPARAVAPVAAAAPSILAARPRGPPRMFVV